MKLRHGFVSNSSSTAFIIKNRTGDPKTLVDFVKENPQLVELFNEEYGYEFTQEQMLADAERREEEWKPWERKWIAFGDEDGDVIGHVFDYILRDCGRSDGFDWHFEEYLR